MEAPGITSRTSYQVTIGCTAPPGTEITTQLRVRAPGLWLRPGCRVRNGRRLRPGTGPGTEHDQHDPYHDERDAADEQANADPKRVRDGQIQPSGERHRGGSVGVQADHPVG